MTARGGGGVGEMGNGVQKVQRHKLPVQMSWGCNAQ